MPCLGPDLPLFRDVDTAGNAVFSRLTFSVVDANLLAVLTALRVALGVFFLVGAVLLLESGFLGEAGFVTFPSDARSLIR